MCSKLKKNLKFIVKTIYLLLFIFMIYTNIKGYSSFIKVINITILENSLTVQQVNESLMRLVIYFIVLLGAISIATLIFNMSFNEKFNLKSWIKSTAAAIFMLICGIGYYLYYLTFSDGLYKMLVLPIGPLAILTVMFAIAFIIIKEKLENRRVEYKNRSL